MTTQRTGRLTPDQAEFYQKNGYLLYEEPVFSQETFGKLKAIFEEDLAKHGEAGLFNAHLQDPRLLEFLLCDEMLDMVEPVVGPNIATWTSSFICKPPRVGKITPWHEDSSYWNGRLSTMAGICSVWLAIDEATPQNGCMAVIPGTHANGFSEYIPTDQEKNIFGSEIDPAKVDETKAVYFALKPNHGGLFEGRIIHGAKANTSDTRRAGYAMRYFPATSLVNPEACKDLKFWLARGKDVAGNKYENA